MGLIAAAAVAAVGAGASAYMQNRAAHGAANAQLRALDDLQYLDINDLKQQATKTDTDRYRTQFDVQRRYDPEFATMREQGARNIVSQLNADASGNTVADQSLTKANSAADLSDKQNAPVIQALIDQAKQDLASGASMSPEFQSQLIKAGLENAGASSGVSNLNGSGASGSTSRRLLGMEGIKLQQARAAEAESLAGAAGGLQTERQSALSNLIALDNNLRASKFARAQTGSVLGSSSIPSIGLTGGDVVNMNIANMNQRNAVTQSRGALNAQKQLADGQMWSKIIGAGTSMLGGMMGGGAGGMMGGVSGGGGGGGFGSMMGSGGSSGSWISGLFGGGSGAPSYNPNLSADDNRANNALFGLGAR